MLLDPSPAGGSSNGVVSLQVVGPQGIITGKLEKIARVSLVIVVVVVVVVVVV